MKEGVSSHQHAEVTKHGFALPGFLYKTKALQTPGISPYAAFDPVAATRGQGWTTSTAPLSKPQKKAVVMGSEAFDGCKGYDNRLGFVAVLQELGFEVYIKSENAIALAPTDISLLEKMLRATATTTPKDYKIMVKNYGIARDDCLLLTSEQALYIRQKWQRGLRIHIGNLYKDSKRLECLFLDPDEIPFECACEKGDLAFVRYLIKTRKCDVNQVFSDWDSSRQTPLHVAYRKGHLALVKYLINECGAKVNAIHNKDSLLHLACQKGDLEFAKYLIEKQGAELNAIGSLGETPLYRACEYGHGALVDYLVNVAKADVTLANKDGYTPLHIACDKDNLEIVRCLAKAPNVNLNAVTREEHRGLQAAGKTPFHIACTRGSLEIAQCLAQEHGVNTNTADRDGKAPLHAACKSGNLELVKHLIVECKANVNSLDNKKCTPFHVACEKGNLKIVQRLAEDYGADANAVDIHGETPLHKACEWGNDLEVVRYLTDTLKVPVNTINAEGMTPLAKVYNGCFEHTEIARHLIERHGAKMNVEQNLSSMFGRLCSNNRFDLIRLLVETQKPDLDAVDEKGRTLLHIVCENGTAEIVHYLFQMHKMDVNAVDNDGNTPLHIACTAAYRPNHSNQLTIAQCLIEKGNATINAMNKKGQMPLHFACACNNLALVKYLIEQGNAQEHSVDENGWTPLHWACDNDRLEIAQYFLKKYPWLATVTDMRGRTILHLASGDSLNSHYTTSEVSALTTYLVKTYPALIDIRSKDNRTPFDFACTKGWVSYTRPFLEANPALLNSYDTYGATYFTQACRYGSVGIVQYLVENYDVDVNKSGKNSAYTPLGAACQAGNLNLVKYLIEERNAKLGNTQQLLKLACRGQSRIDGRLQTLEIIRYLIEQRHVKVDDAQELFDDACEVGDQAVVHYYLKSHNAKVNAVDGTGHTAFLKACRSGNPYLVQDLIEDYQADVNAVTNDKRTALHLACEAGKSSTVTYLVKRFPQLLNKVDSHGRTPLAAAYFYNQNHIVDLLQEKGGISQQPLRRANGIYVASNALSNTAMRPELEKDPSFTMVNAGEVLNSVSASPEIRTTIIRYKDITKSLELEEYVPATFEKVAVPLLSDQDIQSYRQQKDGIYCQFTLKIPAGKRVRLLSAGPQEELLGMRAYQGQEPVGFRPERGDDDFFYVTTEKACTITYVTRTGKALYEFVDKAHPIRKTIDTFIATPQPPAAQNKVPSYSQANHTAWLKHIYQNRVGACRHFTAAVVANAVGQGAQEGKDIRIVQINRNHQKVEMLHNGKWISCPDLGGAPGRLEYDDKTSYTPPAAPSVLATVGMGILGILAAPVVLPVMGIQKLFSGAAKPAEPPKAIPEARKPATVIPLIPSHARPPIPVEEREPIEPLKSTQATQAAAPAPTWRDKVRPPATNQEETFRIVTELDELMQYSLGGTNNRVLLCAADSALSPLANRFIQEARIGKQPVYYIDGPDKMDIGDETVICRTEGGILSDSGHFERFIEAMAARKEEPAPLLIVNWTKFTPQQKLQLNTLLDPHASARGKALPANIAIISLDRLEQKDKSHISRHGEKLQFIGTLPEQPASEQAVGQVVDLQGFPDWRAELFGRLVVKDNAIVWQKSDFTRALETAHHSKTPLALQLTNMAPEHKQAFLYELEQARAFGAFHYHGYSIPIGPEIQIHCPKKTFDFKDVSPAAITVSCTQEQAPPGIPVINSYGFDQLLYSKTIVNGVYDHTPGLIEKKQGKPLHLYVSAPLSEGQWYCAFHQAKKYGVTLNIHTSLEKEELPKGLQEHCKAISKQSQPGSIVSRPKIIVTNNAKHAIMPRAHDATVIHVEDYSSLDLLYGTPQTPAYDKAAARYKAFHVVESPISPQLADGKKFIFAGEFSDRLLQDIAPLFAGALPGSENLTVVIEDNAVHNNTKHYAPLSWLPKDTYTVQYHETPKEVAKSNAQDWKEPAPDPKEKFDPEHSKEMTQAFIERRLDKLGSMLQNHAMVQIIGEAAVGKSSLVREFGKRGDVELFHGLDAIKQWARKIPDAQPKTKLLVLDEADIANTHYTMFEPLKGNPADKPRYLLYNGEILEIGKDCKVVFMMNTKKDAEGYHYNGGRHEQKLFEDRAIPQIHLQPFSVNYIYEKMLRPIDDTLNPQDKDGFIEACKTAIVQYPPRTAQEEMLKRVMKDKVILSSLQAKEFVSTPATNDVQFALELSLSIRQEQRKAGVKDYAVGTPGVLIEGKPGMGKTEMIRATLAARGIEEAKTLEELSPSKAQRYYKIDASLPDTTKEKIITLAQDNGHVVWIDEITSCIDQGLEKTLNAAMTNENPVTKKEAITPGFMVLATTNFADQEGRSTVGKALRSRFTSITMPHFKTYDDQSLQTDIQHAIKHSDKVTDKNSDISNLAKAVKADPRVHNLRDLQTYLPAIANAVSAGQTASLKK